MGQYSSVRDNAWVKGFVYAAAAVALVVLLVFLAVRLLPMQQVAMFCALLLLHLGTALILVPAAIARLLRKRGFDSTQRMGYQVLGVVLILMGWLQAWTLLWS
ncbi:hypothetical protein CWE09_11940 [Aliidiomarina minuta]|uniref:Uncharacterized protein n=1 Tax=Aliidiomarina minuta TaxID=880057 RepID=A0A432W3E6_9GAMM|nr:hypothetical protein [Aliidiomarina minuta]RUO23857.1 hypothetical protein CWE09_11940 [Aliidiomarina minuta]